MPITSYLSSGQAVKILPNLNKEIYTNFYDQNIQTTPDKTIRPEIVNMLLSGKAIKRFTGNDLPDGAVIDTVYTHTLRSQSVAYCLNISQNEKELIAQTLLLHDLPEVMTVLARGGDSDITSPQKEQNPQLDKLIAHEEYEYAKENFTTEEFLLYKDFEESGNYLKGRDYDPNHLTAIGVFAQLIDKCDANLLLHFSLAKWAITPDYDPTQIPTSRSLTYLFRQYSVFQPKVSGEALNYYEECYSQIKQVWQDVKKLGILIPSELIPYLD